MKTLIVIIIILALFYLLIREFWTRRERFTKLTEPAVVQGERTIEEIMEGKTFDELYDELDAKDLEDLTPNESHVLLHVNLYLEQNRS